jgi:hypothetical protein
MRFFILNILLIGISLSAFSQNQVNTLSGYVRDSKTGEELIGVNIVIPALREGTSSNLYGFYSLSLKPGNYEASIQYIGYQTRTIKVALNEDLTLNIELDESSTTLDEVTVLARRLDENVRSVEMSVAQLDMKDVRKMPALLGEVDIIRSLTLLPGISTIGEASNGFNVRGGNTDQNLILLDEAPVYNSSHLFGFFSIFNADAVKDVKLYKGGIPARYGGRLSSVVDVRQRNGNNKKFSSTGGIGLLSSRLLVEGPIQKDKSAFMIAARRSYADLFLSLSNDPTINQNTLYFYDLNAKLNYILGDKDRLYLSGYFGRDVFELNDLFGFDWGNATASLRWNHLFSDKLFSNFTLVFSDYTYSLGTPEDDEFNFRLKSTIQDYHFKNQYNYYVSSKNEIEFGVEGIYYRLKPGQITGSIQLQLQQEYALEPSVYFSQELELGTRWTVQYGLRYSSFYNLGAQKVRNYANPDLPQLNELIDSEEYSSGQIIEAYNGLEGLEPRFSVNYRISDEQSIKASYNRTRQYIHLISNTSTPTPVDLYRPSGRHIQPATANQVAAGYFQNFAENRFEVSIEGYYKDFKNIVDYRNGANLIFNEAIETEILPGIGRSYGLEFYLRKRKGRLSGWLSYTLSKTELKVENDDPLLAINAGEWYPANYDKRHDISLVLNYQLTKKWDLGMNFTYQSGRPITPPEGRFNFEDYSVPVYRSRNSLRIPDYHRLDLSANYTPEKDPNKKFYSSWSLGFYNVYARRNAYSIFFQQAEQAEGATTASFDTEAVQLAIFGTIIPSVTWNFNF